MISFNKNVFPFLRSVYFIFVIVLDEIFLLLYDGYARIISCLVVILVRCIASVINIISIIASHSMKKKETQSGCC